MALIASLNGTTRRVYLDPAAAVGGVITFHPTDNLYTEYRTLRRTNEAYRKFNALLNAAGNVPKGGGKFTPRFTLLLNGTKVVIPNGVPAVTITGELLTDDGSDPFDTSLVTGPCIIRYQPSEAEVIVAGGGGGGSGASAADVWAYGARTLTQAIPTASEIAAAVRADLASELAKIMAVPLAADNADAVWAKTLP